RGGTGSSAWDVILSPGRVWSEAGDGGLSRASFPFILAGRVWNESHNGLATFVYDDNRVSHLQIQIVQEAANWNRFSAWGRLPAKFTPHAVDSTVVVDFRAELAARLPMNPWSELPGVTDPDLVDRFDGGARHVITSGLVVDGVLYARPCATKFGDYPYCAEMRHGVYSMTKSMGAGLALLRLAAVYGDDVFDLKIEDFVDVTAGHNGWAEVTFGDALNMTTGVGDLSHDPTSPNNDEDHTPEFWTYADAMGAERRLRMAFAGGNYPWAPGEVFRYRSIDSYVLAAAMDAFVKREMGPDADLWDMMIGQVLRPIGVAYAPMMHTREGDGGRGVPIMGWGLYPILDEMAKIAGLFQSRGVHRGQRLLSADGLRAVFPTEAEPGLPALWDNVYGAYRYRSSFWFMPFRGNRGCFVWIPEMLGFGGNIIALMPNGMIAIRLSDDYKGASGQYEGESMARLADHIEPFCEE
ncbi:MAG: serine hydrolase, partial [Alphaproteobacteria bacterium]